DPGERPPAQVRLDAEQEHCVLAHPRRPRMEEDRLRPVDPPRVPVLEPDLGSRRLEVEEALRVDLREPLRVPGLREIARRERRPLAAVVPPADGGIKDGAVEGGPPGDVHLRHYVSLRTGRQSRATRPTVQPKRAAPSATCRTTTHHGTVPYVRYWYSPSP